MGKHVMMIIANSPNPSYFRWFAELNHKEKACKLSFIFMHTENPALAEEMKKYGVESHWIHFNTYKSKPLQYIKTFFKLFFLFKKLKPDVVQTNLFDDSLPALFAAKLAGIKKRIITKQDTGYHVNYAPSVVKYDKFNNANATHLIACSEESKEFILKNENGDANKITLIHHGVDEQFISTATNQQIEEVKKRFHLEGKTTIGTIARYIPLKGYADLINAMEKLKDKFPDLIFLGVGYGAQKTEIEKLIEEKKLKSRFILTDLIDYNLMPAVYRNFKIYVHAAKLEPFGFVIAEAMFNKCPIVTTRVGASRDFLVHKESAYLVNFDAPDEIANGIEYLLTHQNDAMVQKAYAIAKNNFSREIMWSKYKTLYIS